MPVLFQDAVIRSALALKLHCFEDTGAIVAATTTSIPEAPGSGRTWDYRYCWLRDAYYVLGAFHLLGQFEERERFIQWLFDVAGGSPDLDLAPLYRVDGRTDLEERLVPGWPGFGGHGPVRVGNGAALQRQNDIFGETALALSPVFLDERFQDEQSPATLALLTRLARKAVAVAGTPDAGIWEVRAPVHARTFSSLMSWAAADRVAVVLHARKADGAAEFAAGAARIRDDILHQAWNGTTGAFAATYGGSDLDASLLQMAPLRFLPADDPRLGATVDAVTRGLGRDGWIWRYADDDGPGNSPGGLRPLHALAGGGPGRPGAWRRGPAHAGTRAGGPEPPRPPLRGLRPSGRRALGQLPAGLLARRPHPRGVRSLARLGRRALTWCIHGGQARMAIPSRAEACAFPAGGRSSTARQVAQASATRPRFP